MIAPQVASLRAGVMTGCLSLSIFASCGGHSGVQTRNMSAPSVPTSPLWVADMETGNLIQWEANVFQSSPCGGQFNSGPSASTVATWDVVHSGLWSAKMTIGSDTIGTESGTRLFRWCEPQRNRELYYSVWYYLPTRLDVHRNGWMNIFQFKSK